MPDLVESNGWVSCLNNDYKMLKKFTQFNEEITKTGDRKTSITRKDARKSAQKVVKKKSDKPPKINIPEMKEPKIKTIHKTEEPKMENFDFIGKIVKFPPNIKPSVSIVMLENNNISKEKLHYIISKQTKDSLVVLKYN